MQVKPFSPFFEIINEILPPPTPPPPSSSPLSFDFLHYIKLGRVFVYLRNNVGVITLIPSFILVNLIIKPRPTPTHHAM